MTMYAGFAIRSHIQSATYRNDVNVKMKKEKKAVELYGKWCGRMPYQI